MYIHSECPYCGKDVKKIGISVIKPGIIACPECGKLSQVAGTFRWLSAYIMTMLIAAIVLKPFMVLIDSDWVIVLFFAMVFMVINYIIAVFLHLEK